MPDEVPVERHRVESFDNDDDAPPLAGTSTDADATLEDDARADWLSASGSALRERRARAEGEEGGASWLDDDEAEAERRRAADDEIENARLRRLCGVACLVVLLLALAIAGAVVYLRRFPTPLSCALDHVRPVKFKIDVTDFWAPRISATLQAVLNVGNRNLLDLLLLEACKVTVYEARTGLKLGSASSNALTISPFSSTTVSVNVLGIGANAPQPEQKRIASTFLEKKWLLLTFVATATSRLPFKGSKASSVTSNATRRVDLSSMYKEPWTQRAPAPPAADDASKVHDVPV